LVSVVLFISFACPKEMNQRKGQSQIFFGKDVLTICAAVWVQSLLVMSIMRVRWQTENGANCCMFGSANMALRSGRTNRLQLSFSAPFLWFFLWTNKERTNTLLEEQKNRSPTAGGR
jgi:hypothetical protein